MAYPTVERYEIERCEGACNRGPWILRAYYSDGRSMCNASSHYPTRALAREALKTTRCLDAWNRVYGRADAR